jgi:drug/metabolite transporter (DMT)-like permease
MKTHSTAVFQALFVVFLWATSWVFIKMGLQDIPPLTFAGLRYTLASLCLVVLWGFRRQKVEVPRMTRSTWIRLIALGVLFYALTQGASFIALNLLPAVTVNLLWSFSSVAVAILGIFWLSEHPTWQQWSGITLVLIGAVIFFTPASFRENFIPGLIAAGVGVLANAVSSILGREINRARQFPTLFVTVISMGTGAVVLLGTGLSIEGFPEIDIRGWGIILWLAVVNTAFAFTLWNHTLRTLTAVESSIINGTMLIWIPVLAVLFLGEQVSWKEAVALVLVGIGTLVVQLRRENGPGRSPDGT